MATIKTSCPNCGDVDLGAETVLLSVCTYRPWSYYSFICPRCSSSIEKAANDTVIGLLRGGGVAINEWHVPAEALEPRPNGSLSADHLLEFHEQLQRADLLVALLPGRED